MAPYYPFEPRTAAEHPMRTLTLLAALLALGGCAVYAEPAADAPRRDGGPAAFKVPPGHMPPPGSCRIWFPDRPPGQQPAPGDCRHLRHHVPPGAVLIRG